jgi:hypothetical protein
MTDLFLIKKKGKLKDVISQKDYHVGATVLFICCEETKIPTEQTVQLDVNYHIIDPIVKEINHSLDPNVKVEGHSLVAIRKIKAGDAILRNYYETEEIIIKEFRDRETGDLVNTKNLLAFKYGDDEFDYLNDY